MSPKNNNLARVTRTFSNSVDQVWDALVNPVTVKKYFFDTDMHSTWKIGDYIYFEGIFEGKPYVDKGIINGFEPNKLLSYNYRSSWSETEDIPQNYLLVKFELMSEGSKTTLIVTQECFSEKEALDSTKNWNFVLDQMQTVIQN